MTQSQDTLLYRLAMPTILTAFLEFFYYGFKLKTFAA